MMIMSPNMYIYDNGVDGLTNYFRLYALFIPPLIQLFLLYC